jgi:hypothetical protein
VSHEQRRPKSAAGNSKRTRWKLARDQIELKNKSTREQPRALD